MVTVYRQEICLRILPTAHFGLVPIEKVKNSPETLHVTLFTNITYEKYRAPCSLCHEDKGLFNLESKPGRLSTQMAVSGTLHSILLFIFKCVQANSLNTFC